MSVAFGGGWAWVSSMSGHVARVDPKANQVVEEFRISERSYKHGLIFDTAVVAEGALWLCGLPGREVFRIDFQAHATSHSLLNSEPNNDRLTNEPVSQE